MRIFGLSPIVPINLGGQAAPYEVKDTAYSAV